MKLAVAASLASILTRSTDFQRMLMREERTLTQRVKMALVCALIYGAGRRRARARQRLSGRRPGDGRKPGDGDARGYVTGLLAGVFIAIPALFEADPLTMLLFAAPA